MVNRNSYLSLLESVNEAVVGTSKITKTIRAGKPVTSQGTNTAVGGGNASNSGMQWGDPSIGGAMNGAQLAAWLNSQSSGGPANPSVPNTPKTDSLWLSNAKTIGGARPGTTKVTRASMASMAEASKVTRRAGKPVASQGTTDRTGSSMQWGSPSVGGAMNGAQLAAWLNSQSSGVATNPAKPNKVTRASMASMAEEWDEVDEILAEALEMFGEEDLVTILEYFEETGELPDEFIDLIVSING